MKQWPKLGEPFAIAVVMPFCRTGVHAPGLITTSRPMIPIAPTSRARRFRECPLCGLFQTIPVVQPAGASCCGRCGSVLRHHRTDPVGRGLALALSAMVLFLLATTLPFLTLDLGGGSHITVIDGPEALGRSGMWEVGLVVLGTTMVFPLARLGGIVWVLIGLRRSRSQPSSHLATVFRWVETLAPWSMIEVFMLGVFVAYTKLSDLAPVHVGGGVYALGGLMLAMAATDAVLDHEAIWERLEPAGVARASAPTEPAPDLVSDHAPDHAQGPGMAMIGCDACGLVSRQPPTTGQMNCPRCGERLRARKTNSTGRAWALLVASAVLYVPANVLPVLSVARLGRGEPSTILEGVHELGVAGQWPLAALVFIASIAVPVLKILGLALLLISTSRHATTQLGQRTLLYRIVEAAGRWSMIDVFMISILTALVDVGPLATITPGPGVLCFCAVVILTMLAANSFDPRLMWDAAASPRTAA